MEIRVDEVQVGQTLTAYGTVKSIRISPKGNNHTFTFTDGTKQSLNYGISVAVTEEAPATPAHDHAEPIGPQVQHQAGTTVKILSGSMKGLTGVVESYSGYAKQAGYYVTVSRAGVTYRTRLNTEHLKG